MTGSTGLFERGKVLNISRARSSPSFEFMLICFSGPAIRVDVPDEVSMMKRLSSPPPSSLTPSPTGGRATAYAFATWTAPGGCIRVCAARQGRGASGGHRSAGAGGRRQRWHWHVINAAGSVHIAELGHPKGRGLFAERAYRPGEALLAPAPVAVLERRGLSPETARYAFAWARGRRALAFGLVSLCNHADAPNAAAESDFDARTIRLTDAHIILYARRPLLLGDAGAFEVLEGEAVDAYYAALASRAACDGFPTLPSPAPPSSARRDRGLRRPDDQQPGRAARRRRRLPRGPRGLSPAPKARPRPRDRARRVPRHRARARPRRDHRAPGGIPLLLQRRLAHPPGGVIGESL